MQPKRRVDHIPELRIVLHCQPDTFQFRSGNLPFNILPAEFFESRVRPVLSKNCYACHTNSKLGGLQLDSREHVLQGADYWRRVEAHRRRGHIAKAKLFGEREIRDEAPLVYLVAPTLRVHPAFQTLARCISPDIEIYRFDINEDWRSGVRVMRRHRVN